MTLILDPQNILYISNVALYSNSHRSYKMADILLKPVSLNTANGDGSQGEYYDEVLAVSQDAINENFNAFLQQQPNLAEVFLNDGRTVLKATLDAPKIKVGVDPAQGEREIFSLELRYSFVVPTYYRILLRQD